MKFSLSLTATLALGAAAADFKYTRLDREKAVVAVVDHQVGLMHLVRDIEPTMFKASVLAHAETAKAFDLPIVMTASAETGPNGPLLGEITRMYPNVTVIQRGGEVNAMDNKDFRAALAATNRTQVILAGIVTDVLAGNNYSACLRSEPRLTYRFTSHRPGTAFAALSMIEAGYTVFANGDASGTSSELARELANDRMRQAGVQILTTFAVYGELMRDWRTPPTGVQVWPFVERMVTSAGILGRSHGAAVQKGQLMPGQDALPW
ncbi:hypothetical protein RB593_009252 [Gaeumannomyces tritici]